jgi:hypothetical protein
MTEKKASVVKLLTVGRAAVGGERVVGVEDRVAAGSLRGARVLEERDGALDLGRDRRGLDHHEPGAALGKLAKMNKVPVIGEAVGRRILAHRCDDDPVGERQPADGDRLEQLG